MGGEDADEYRRSVRARLRELVDRAGEPQAGAAPDWLLVYACPPAAGPASKPAGKVRACTKAHACFGGCWACSHLLQHTHSFQQNWCCRCCASR